MPVTQFSIDKVLVLFHTTDLDFFVGRDTL